MLKREYSRGAVQKMKIHHIDTEQYLISITRLIAEGRQVTIPVRGNSMSPFLADGRDSVLLGPPPERLRRGDIVLFRRRSGQFILHRIIDVKSNASGKIQYYIRGDAQEITEGPVLSGQICAVVVKSMRKGRWLTSRDPYEIFFRHVWCRKYFPRTAVMRIFRRIL